MEIRQFIHSPFVLLSNGEAIKEVESPADVAAEIQTVNPLTHLLEKSMNAMNRSLGHLLKAPSIIDKSLSGTDVEHTAQHVIAELVEQIHSKQDRANKWALQVRQCCAVMASGQDTGLQDEGQLQQLNDEQNRILRLLKEHPEQDPPLEIVEALDETINSSDDFFEKLLELISLIKHGYLAGYERVIAAYTAFFTDFNAQITAMMKDWIEGANDGKEVKLDVKALRAALSELIAKYTHPNDASVLFPDPDKGGTSKEEADKWREALGLPPQCLKQNADGTWCVVIDTSPLETMKKGLPPEDTVTWDTAKFNAWQSGFNAQEESMKNMLQSYTQKYSNANSYHDNFNKTLSAHLNQYADMLKAMLNF
ncbi:IpaD/SipD/SspD family type III secretion system needle tip protein [Pseudomonas brassicacearum]|uniref:IpaD/SipD/SspD family type III secretion system needle tip protein n=1 Tax=Pseudomonas brassicacearum TaxID=930166 RepID=UPI001DB7614D|nr:IpaD/SipD/SspD family type III secretion system needle tip protein [Pseudomonas brassicacearum]CAH0214244.1 Cell invasion protein SipD [Pseudomonas brassicacearum]